ncbi:hypothetical protein D3C72_1393770 [compost metagenome]
MYNTNYVISGLMTGTQWDVMINKINSIDSSKSLTNSTWGNFKNQSIIYTGKIASATYTSNIWYLTTFSNYSKNATKPLTSGTAGWLLTTGASEQAKAYNLYDVAGSLWEWTEESSLYGGTMTSQYRSMRGASFAASDYAACYRQTNISDNTLSLTYGFRVVLYMK